ncbi:MAG: hypothetical protein ACKO40_08990 [Planctomycetaceae bacterium]
MNRMRAWLFGLTIAVVCFVVRGEETTIPDAPARNDPPRVFVSGVKDDFAKTRAAIAAAKQASGRDYRVVVVDSLSGAEDARGLLEKVVERWRQEAEASDGGFNPAGDVTIVLDVGDRQIAMDVPWSLEAAGLDSEVLLNDLIGETFRPRAKDGQLDEGLAELVGATERWVRDEEATRRQAAEAARLFRTRTLPMGLAGLGAAGLLGSLAVQWTRHHRRLRTARDKLAAFKAEVVTLSDLLDSEQERHRMLPHADPDFQTPMQGMTRAAYDGVQGAIRRYRERWLGLMDVWEKAQAKVDSEWFLGTSAADEAIGLLDSAEARPPLPDVAAECKAPLDSLETAHEEAREAVVSLDAALGDARTRLDAVAARGRSNAAFQGAVADVARGRQRFGELVESDPVAARGGLEEARSALEATVARVDALEAVDDRRQRAAATNDDVVARVRGRRAEGWLLDEPGANPDDRLTAAAGHAATAAQLLDAGETDAAAGTVERAERATAEAAALLESVVAARTKAEELLPACVARVEAIIAARRRSTEALERLAGYGAEAWSDVSENVARADDGLVRVKTLLDEARAALAPERQHYLRAVALLEEVVRQEDWVEGCLAAVTDRLAELDGLRSALPGKRDRAVERVTTLARRLQRQRTDRVSANERCREAGRIIEVADQSMAVARPDPRQATRLIEAADAAVARGEQLADEDERLARQAANDIDETDALVRRVAAWYAEGVQADVRSAAAAVDAARSLLERQRYEESIQTTAEASRQARIAYATATAEADRRRIQRQQEIQRRQLEESFARMSRGAGPWVVRLPGSTFTGPDPWRSMTPQRPRSTPTVGSWSRDVVQTTW